MLLAFDGVLAGSKRLQSVVGRLVVRHYVPVCLPVLGCFSAHATETQLRDLGDVRSWRTCWFAFCRRIIIMTDVNCGVSSEWAWRAQFSVELTTHVADVQRGSMLDLRVAKRDALGEILDNKLRTCRIGVQGIER